MVLCPSCGKSFSLGGYRNHVRQADDPDCHAIYLQSLEHMDVDSENEPEVDEDLDLDLMGLPVIKNHNVGDLEGYDDLQADNVNVADYDVAMEGLHGRGDESEQDEEDGRDKRDERDGGYVGDNGDKSDRGDESDEEEGYAGLEPHWEFPPEEPLGMDNIEEEEAPLPPELLRGARLTAEDAFRTIPVKEKFPSLHAGAPIPNTQSLSNNEAYQRDINEPNNPWAPFSSQMDWEIARWAKLQGPGSTAMSDLLKIDGVCEQLGLSYRNSKELNQIIDQLPSRPKFHRSEVVIAGEVFEMYSRDIIDCIKSLFGDPEFTSQLLLSPERHYTNAAKTKRMFHEMTTGKWWWSTQKVLEERKPGATIVPVILSSDKTLLTAFGNKMAYPVYLTIGNIPKGIRRKPSRHSHILLAYLPTAQLHHIPNKAARRRTMANLYHSCMSQITEPLKQAGAKGVQMSQGDGIIHRNHPIIASQACDYQEQVLVTATKTGGCPTCPIPFQEVGESMSNYQPRELDPILAALQKADGNPTEFWRACRDAGIKPVYHPFWENLPYTHIYRSMTPDILHQLYQGVIRHLIAWIKKICGNNEIDARCRRLPPNHNIRLFVKGISNLSRVTGKEHAQMASFLLGIIIGIKLPGGLSSARLLRAVRGILDFLYLAQYPLHTSDTLDLLQKALKQFHDYKSIFLDLGIRENFGIPKLHSLDHYAMYIELLGTTDNFNTEYTERLHIDLAKDAWRATNYKDEYSQMTIWLERCEKIFRHDKYIKWKTCPPVPPPDNPHPGVLYQRELKMTKHPSKKNVKFHSLIHDYNAINFKDALVRWFVQLTKPHLHGRQIEQQATNTHIPFNAVHVYHKIKFTSYDPYIIKGSNTTVVDAIHVRPTRKNKHNQNVPARFDTVLINDGTGKEIGVKGYRIGQVHVVFSLSPRVISEWFPHGISPPEHLAYVEWFSAFSEKPDADHGLFKVDRSFKNGQRLASIVPVYNIRRSAHLFPNFGHVAPREWASHTVLDNCTTFFANSTSDRHIYATFI